MVLLFKGAEISPSLVLTEDSGRSTYNRRVTVAYGSTAQGGDSKSFEGNPKAKAKAVDAEFVKNYWGTLFKLPLIAAFIVFTVLYRILCRTTGHGFVGRRKTFKEIHRMYSRSHFSIVLEVMVILIAYQIYGAAASQNPKAFVLFMFSIMWFLFVSWLFVPFLFNPSGFEGPKITEDWKYWHKWMDYEGSIYRYRFDDRYKDDGADLSWEFWWDNELTNLQYNTGFCGRLWKIISPLRFFVYQYVFIYQLHVGNIDQSIKGDCLSWSWPVIVAAMIISKIGWFVLKKFDVDVHEMRGYYRLILHFLGVFIFDMMAVTFTMSELFSFFFIFLPTGWGVLQVAEACKPFVEVVGMWGWVESLAFFYDLLIGLPMFSLVTFVALYPSTLEFQTLLLNYYNQKHSAKESVTMLLPPV